MPVAEVGQADQVVEQHRQCGLVVVRADRSPAARRPRRARRRRRRSGRACAARWSDRRGWRRTPSSGPPSATCVSSTVRALWMSEIRSSALLQGARRRADRSPRERDRACRASPCRARRALAQRRAYVAERHRPDQRVDVADQLAQVGRRRRPVERDGVAVVERAARRTSAGSSSTYCSPIADFDDDGRAHVLGAPSRPGRAPSPRWTRHRARAAPRAPSRCARRAGRRRRAGRAPAGRRRRPSRRAGGGPRRCTPQQVARAP